LPEKSSPQKVIAVFSGLVLPAPNAIIYVQPTMIALLWKGGEDMTKLELLTVLYSLDSHLDKDDIVTARNVVKRIIAEAEKRPQDKKNDKE